MRAHERTTHPRSVISAERRAQALCRELFSAAPHRWVTMADRTSLDVITEVLGKAPERKFTESG
ncbi:MAG: hypothetical protein ACREB9_06355, partial [Thermoplasmata archaeon]